MKPWRGRRHLGFCLVWIIGVMVAAIAVHQLWVQHQLAARHLLEQRHSAREIGWRTILSQAEARVLSDIEGRLNGPELESLLTALGRTSSSGEVSPAVQAQMRNALAALTGPEFKSLFLLNAAGFGLLNTAERGASSWQRDGWQTPYGLALASASPIFGFEPGPQGLSWRLLVPLVDQQGQALGALMFSLDPTDLFNEFAGLLPQDQVELLIRRSTPRLLLADPDSISMSEWPGSPLFWDAKPSAMAGESGNPTNRTVRAAALHQAMASSIKLGRQVARSTPEPFRVRALGGDFAMLPIALSDLQGRSVGVLLAAGPEPALGALDTAFHRHVVVLFVMVFLLCALSHRLLRTAASRASDRARLELITRSLGQGLYVTNGAGIITEINSRAAELLGFEVRDLIGKRAEDVFYRSGDNPHGLVGMRDGAETDSDPKPLALEQSFRRKDGALRQVALQCVPLDKEGGSIVLFDDVTRQKTQESQLKQIAHFDALTGLANRVLLAERLALAMSYARRSRSRLALAFIDLDGFKAINDTHGHNIGDRLLVRLGRRMQTVVRDSDTVARLGGDEFAVVLTDIHEEDCFAPMLERLLDALAQPELIDGKTMQVSASIGVSLYPQGEEVDADQLLRQADQAMYEAKLAGKRRYRVFDPDHHADLRGRNERLERLRVALSRGELRLYYQPCINLANGSLQAVEALLRWQNPNHGLLPPAAFLPWIRRDDMEIEVGRWVLRTAIQQLDQWRQFGMQVTVSVNIAGEHLQDPSFVDELQQELARWPEVRPQQLQLEIVESSALENIDEICEVISACSALGVRVALDDFGTGYSSLTYLKRLPVHLLKLDRSFVEGMLYDTEDLTIVDGVLRLARAFNLQVVAEGVETKQQRSMLRRLGCELAQGYNVARPMPPSGFERWLKSWPDRSDWVAIEPLPDDKRDILYAMVEHRAWLRSLRSFLEQPGAVRSDSRPGPSRLRKRLEAGLVANWPGAIHEDLLKADQHVHRLADELIRLRLRAESFAAMERWHEVEQAGEELIFMLDRLMDSKNSARRATP